MRADFANVVAKQKAREQMAKENSSWMAGGRRRMMALKSKLSEDGLSRLRVSGD
jgi:hypothetical protein